MRLRILVMLPALLCFLATICTGGGPSIHFDKDTHDYGRVLYGDVVTQEFILTNTGDETLVIDKLEASCGCTKAVKGSSEVPPKGTTKIMAAFDTDGLRNGRTKKTITVHSNDPEKPEVKLALLADVVREITVDPPRLVTRLAKFTETVSLPVRIANSSDKQVVVRIKDGQSDTSNPGSNTKALVVKGRSVVPFNLKLALKNESGRSSWAGRLTLLTDHPKEKELNVPYLVQLGQGDSSEPKPPPTAVEE
jgi:hypothetical protein